MADEATKALLYVSAELRHMRLTHQLGEHTQRKVDSLIRHCERATTPLPAAPVGEPAASTDRKEPTE